MNYEIIIQNFTLALIPLVPFLNKFYQTTQCLTFSVKLLETGRKKERGVDFCMFLTIFIQGRTQTALNTHLGLNFDKRSKREEIFLHCSKE